MQERGTVAPLSGSRRRALVVAAMVAVLVVVADQVTTSIAEADLHRPVHLVGPVGLALRYNSGTAFSLFTGAGWGLVPLIVVLVAVVAGLAWRSRSLLLSVGYGLVLGGAIGNLADRLVRGHHGDVVDFVTLSHWPTFNVADACITAGIVVVALGWLRTPLTSSRGRGVGGAGGGDGRDGHDATDGRHPGTRIAGPPPARHGPGGDQPEPAA